MTTLIDWLLALIDAGESINGLRVRLEMLKRVFSVVSTSYGREDVVEALAKEDSDA